MLDKNAHAEWLRANFKVGGKGFTDNIIKQSGKKYKKCQSTKDFEAHKEWLMPHYDEELIKRDMEPSSTNNIIGLSRPLHEWGYLKLNQAVQKVIFDLKSQDVPLTEKILNEKSQLTFLKENNIDLNNFDFGQPGSPGAAQGRNCIFKNAIARYNGVIIKNENKRDNLIKKGVKEENLPLAVDEAGMLKEPPGINEIIYGYQGSKLEPLTDKKILQSIGLGHYNRKPEDLIYSEKWSDRLKIQSGEIGYIRDKDSVNLYRKGTKQFSSKRRRQSKKIRNDNPILLIAYFGKDWVVFDARGMLRNNYWRKLAKPGTLTISGLMNLFTSDITIDPTKTNNQVLLAYKKGTIKQETLKVIGYKSGHKKLKEICKNTDIALISIDLGQTNPMAYKISKISLNDDDLIPDRIENGSLTKDQHKSLENIRIANDEIELSIKEQAIKLLPEKQKEEIEAFNKLNQSDLVKSILIDKYDISKSSFELMTNRSTIIADILISNKQENEAYYTTKDNKKRKKYDSSFAKENKIKLSKETNDALYLLVWELKKKDERYKKLSLQKKETIRSHINSLVSDVKKNTGLNVVIAIEDLNIKGGFFDGQGKKDSSWEGFFASKKENRWFINAFHKHLSELAMNKGIMVIEVNPKYTSQTCIKCKHCCGENRDGERFKCTQCGYYGNTDIEVAPHNIENVVLTGKSLSGPIVCERSNGELNPVGSRKPNPSISKRKLRPVKNITTPALPLAGPLANHYISY